MAIPDSSLYKDLHDDIEIPSVSMQTLGTYLTLVDKTMDSKARNPYKETFLLHVRFAKTDNS